ncbi:hypothetical protein BKA61DRAFT_726860 [Leptodontidium sp. MPI-SDFR-AT-0119]|nr:hypothetical protein BKA61DRAFT_726860 [Leptodontidium sp. MPI-SDFR-AT-0119]
MDFLRWMFGGRPRDEEPEPQPARIPRPDRPADELSQQRVPVPGSDTLPFHVLPGPAFKPKGYSDALIKNQRAVVLALRYVSFFGLTRQNRPDAAADPLEEGYLLEIFKLRNGKWEIPISSKHLILGAAFIDIEVTHKHTDLVIPKGIQRIGTVTLAYITAKKMAVTYATNQMKFWIKEVMFPFTVHTVLQSYQDPAFLAALKSQKPAQLNVWFASTLTDTKVTYCLRNPWGKAISVDFFMHKGVRQEAEEEALRINLKKWSIDLISSTCTDLYQYAVQMREGEEKPAWCLNQIMANLNALPMSRVVEDVHLNWLALPASEDFGKITRIRTAGMLASTNNYENDEDARAILDMAADLPDR